MLQNLNFDLMLEFAWENELFFLNFVSENVGFKFKKKFKSTSTFYSNPK